jgi:hypothetical protein
LVLVLFTFIGWLTIIVFFLIPKSLNTEENIILFFILNIGIISIYTMLTLNLKLLSSASNVPLFISLWIQRSIITPIGLIILMNLLLFYDKRYKKIIASLVTILLLTFIDLLTVWTGVKNYTGWNTFLTISTFIVLVILYYVLTKLIKKIP